MKKYILEGIDRELFVKLEELLFELQKETGHEMKTPPSFGFSEGDKSREIWSYHFFDGKNSEVLLYEFNNHEGTYKGILKMNLSLTEEKILEQKIKVYLEQLLPKDTFESSVQ